MEDKLELMQHLENFLVDIDIGDKSVLALLNILPCGVSITSDPNCKELRHNPVMAKFLRIKNWGNFSHSAAKTPPVTLFRNGHALIAEEMPAQIAFNTGQEVIGDEIEYLWNDGVRQFAVHNAYPIRNKFWVVIGVILTTQEITQQIMAERELLNTEKKLTATIRKNRDNLKTQVAVRTRELEMANAKLAEQAQLLELAHDYIMVSDMDSKIIYWNHGAEVGYGWRRGEAIGQEIHGFLKTQFHEPTEYIMNRLLTEESWEGEVIHTRKDGERIIVNSHQTLNRDKDGNPVSILEINRDITVQKNIDAELARFDRLNLIGEMAAGIGHEVRNPMTTVRGYLQLFQKREKFAKYQEQFSTMIEELDRANAIITEFLSLAKNKAVEMKLGNINNVIHAIFPLLQADAFRRGHEFLADTGNIPDCIFDEKEIRQLILNLVRNSLEAMEQRGTVTIRTYLDHEHLMMAVTDNGPGMPQEIFDKLGTPFVTTKDNGTGLGLPVCYRIAERHGARIEVSTGPAGTQVAVEFPPPYYVIKKAVQSL